MEYFSVNINGYNLSNFTVKTIVDCVKAQKEIAALGLNYENSAIYRTFSPKVHGIKYLRNVLRDSGGNGGMGLYEAKKLYEAIESILNCA